MYFQLNNKSSPNSCLSASISFSLSCRKLVSYLCSCRCTRWYNLLLFVVAVIVAAAKISGAVLLSACFVAANFLRTLASSRLNASNSESTSRNKWGFTNTCPTTPNNRTNPNGVQTAKHCNTTKLMLSPLNMHLLDNRLHLFINIFVV